MQLLSALSALSTLAALLPLATAKPTPLAHAHHHLDVDFADIDYTDLEPRAAVSYPRCTKRGAHIVATSGQGAPNVGGYGLLSSTVMAIKNAIPYSNNMSTSYDKDNASGAVAAADGVGNLTAHIQWYAAGCPDTPIILLGYSQGAIVTRNTLCGRSVPVSPVNPGIDPIYAKNIAATILYGDETRTPGLPYDYGTCTTGSGVLPRKQTGTCGIFDAVTRSWCDMNDPECCITQSPNADQNVHYVYPSEYDGDATAYAVQNFLGWKAARRQGGTWPVVSAPSSSSSAGGATSAGSAGSATSATSAGSATGTGASSVTGATSIASSYTTSAPAAASAAANARIAAAPAPLGGQTVEGASPTNAKFNAWIKDTQSKVSGFLNGLGYEG